MHHATTTPLPHDKQEIQQLRAAELHEAVSQGVVLLTLELPVFPHAVLYQQSLSAAAVVAQAAATGSAVTAAAGAAGSVSGVADVIRFQDPEVGWVLAGRFELVVSWQVSSSVDPL